MRKFRAGQRVIVKSGGCGALGCPKGPGIVLAHGEDFGREIMTNGNPVHKLIVYSFKDHRAWGMGNDYEIELEEITEPRIELKCIGFEEGQTYEIRSSNHNNLLLRGTWKDNWFDSTDYVTDDTYGIFDDIEEIVYMCVIGEADVIELIQEPTEKEKLEQRQEELREKIDKENLADVIEYLENESKLKELE